MGKEKTHAGSGVRFFMGWNVSTGRGNGREPVEIPPRLIIALGIDLCGAFAVAAGKEPPGIALGSLGIEVAELLLELVGGHAVVEIQTRADMAQIVRADLLDACDGADVPLDER